MCARANVHCKIIAMHFPNVKLCFENVCYASKITLLKTGSENVLLGSLAAVKIKRTQYSCDRKAVPRHVSGEVSHVSDFGRKRLLQAAELLESADGQLANLDGG